MIFAFGEDGTIEVHRSIDDAKREWEPVDVENGVVVFYDDDGTWLKPELIKPNKRLLFGWMLTQGDYTLMRAAAPPIRSSSRLHMPDVHPGINVRSETPPDRT